MWMMRVAKPLREYKIIFAQIIEYLCSIDFDIRKRMTE